ncbi:DUF4232 domain-containing protein [Streptomyces sp. NPDC005931]|uniref:DUF4232 domain-containing protein n=1 Tax=Streptomyces sp. NPDC005931 TaxID=3364737 RepID=UPI0036C24F1C
MRAMPITVTALAAALVLLTACTEEEGQDSDTKPKSTACTLDDVGIEVGPASVAPAAGDTGDVPVGLTNQGAACTLDAFPEVRLVAGGESVALSPTEGAQAQKLTLAKGDSASFTITYVRGPEGAESLGAETLEIGLPGDAATKSFRWSYGPVAGKGGDKATPDASVGAFQQAGD